MSLSFRIRAELAEMILREEALSPKLKAEMMREILQLGDEKAR